MEERNKVIFQLKQNNKSYTVSTSITNDKINLECKDSNSQIYENSFTLPELLKISQYFQPTHSIQQIQAYLNGIIEKQRIGINQADEALSINLHLINNDQISIPLLKKLDLSKFTNYPYVRYNSMTERNNQYMVNQISSQSSPSPKFYSKNSGNIQLGSNRNSGNIQLGSNPNSGNIQLSSNQNSGNIQLGSNQNSGNIQLSSNQNSNNIQLSPLQNSGNIQLSSNQNINNIQLGSNQNRNNIQLSSNQNINNIQLGSNQNRNNIQLSPIQNSNNIQLSPNKVNIVQTKPISSLGGYSYPHADNNIISNFSLDENKLSNLERENNLIKAGQEKLKNDIKRLIQEMTKLKEQNQIYKTNHDSLTNENALLKNENDNLKKQVLLYQKENNDLKTKYETYNKDLDAVEAQNDQIRKMYEDLENEYNQYKSQTEEIIKENELLRTQIEELNNNFTMINQELENIRNENDIFKSNLEQQKKNLNEDVVNKLIEENDLLKKRLEENEYLKKQIIELQYQMQNQENREIQETQEKELDRDQQGQEEEEDKGEIIHNMKELELITDKINKENKKIIINLLYKASVDGDKASVFHDKCDQAKSTIVLVETLNGKRFGGFTSCSWAGNCEDKNDPDAFIFSLDKMKTYENIPGDEAIGCYPKFGPIFLGCQIKIFDNAFTKGGTTFEKELNFNTKEDYELTGGDRVFQIKEIEVYEVIIE